MIGGSSRQPRPERGPEEKRAASELIGASAHDGDGPGTATEKVGMKRMNEEIDESPDRSGDPPRAASAEARALAAAWPRAWVAEGRGEALARWWIQARDSARILGAPPFPRTVLSRPLARALFDARRARQLERGLEGAETRLAAEEAGIDRVTARPAGMCPTRPGRRISRLLLVSDDGSERFYRTVQKVRDRYSKRLEVLVLEADESGLGETAYGSGRRARALLLTHKEAMIRFLTALERSLGIAEEE